MVGATRFELVTFCTPSKRATSLRYAPTGIPAKLSAVYHALPPPSIPLHAFSRKRTRGCRRAGPPAPESGGNIFLFDPAFFSPPATHCDGSIGLGKAVLGAVVEFAGEAGVAGFVRQEGLGVALQGFLARVSIFDLIFNFFQGDGSGVPRKFACPASRKPPKRRVGRVVKTYPLASPKGRARMPPCFCEPSNDTRTESSISTGRWSRTFAPGGACSSGGRCTSAN